MSTGTNVCTRDPADCQDSDKNSVSSNYSVFSHDESTTSKSSITNPSVFVLLLGLFKEDKGLVTLIQTAAYENGLKEFNRNFTVFLHVYAQDLRHYTNDQAQINQVRAKIADWIAKYQQNIAQEVLASICGPKPDEHKLWEQLSKEEYNTHEILRRFFANTNQDSKAHQSNYRVTASEEDLDIGGLEADPSYQDSRSTQANDGPQICDPIDSESLNEALVLEIGNDSEVVLQYMRAFLIEGHAFSKLKSNIESYNTARSDLRNRLSLSLASKKPCNIDFEKLFLKLLYSFKVTREEPPILPGMIRGKWTCVSCSLSLTLSIMVAKRFRFAEILSMMILKRLLKGQSTRQ